MHLNNIYWSWASPAQWSSPCGRSGEEQWLRLLTPPRGLRSCRGRERNGRGGEEEGENSQIYSASQRGQHEASHTSQPRMTDGSWSYRAGRSVLSKLLTEWDWNENPSSVNISPGEESRVMCRKLEDCLLTRTGFRVFVVTAVIVVLAVVGLYRWAVREQQ